MVAYIMYKINYYIVIPKKLFNHVNILKVYLNLKLEYQFTENDI